MSHLLNVRRRISDSNKVTFCRMVLVVPAAHEWADTDVTL